MAVTVEAQPSPASMDPARSRAVAAVFCCAPTDVDAVVGTFGSLGAVGILPRVVPGSDESDGPMREALRGTRGPTLFVVVVGSAMGSARVRELVSAFTELRQREHRLLVLELDPRRPYALVSPVRRGARSLRRQLGLPPTHPVARAVGRSVRLVKSGRAPDAKRDDVGTIPDHIQTPTVEPSRRRLHLVDGDDPDQAEAGPTRDALIDTVEVTPVVAPLAAATAPESETQHRDTQERDTQERDTQESDGQKRDLRWAWAGAAVLAVTWAVGLAGLIAESPRSLTPALAHAPRFEIATPVDAARSDQMPDPGLLERSRAAEPVTLAQGPRREEAESVASDASPSAEVSPEVAAIEAGLEGGHMRALDLLLVAPAAPGGSDWWWAATRCRRRAVAGVRGWRLPSSSELRKLRRSQLVPDGVWWSMTLSVQATVASNWVLDTHAGKMRVIPKHERARTVCVRHR